MGYTTHTYAFGEDNYCNNTGGSEKARYNFMAGKGNVVGASSGGAYGV